MTGDHPAIRHPDESEECFTAELCHILETWNRAEDGAVSIARARVAPGVTTRLHRLRGITERYVVIAGSGQVEVGTLPPSAVAAGDMVFIPSDCPQRITNSGSVDLVFLAICTPRFVSEAYEDIEPPDFDGGVRRKR